MINTNFPLPLGPSPGHTREIFAPVCDVGPAGEVNYRSSGQLAAFLRNAFKDKHMAALVSGVTVATYMKWIRGSKPGQRNLRRLQTAARVTVWLQGSYNEFGLVRWWGRERHGLSGRNPIQVLDYGSPNSLSVLEKLAEFH